MIGLWLMFTVGPWHMRQFGTGAFKDVTGGIQSLITAAGVAIGGYWAYFKFIRGRTFVPRLSIELDGQWRPLAGRQVLHARVVVKNIGAAKVSINQYGSSFEVGFPEGEYESEVQWAKLALETSSHDLESETSADGEAIKPDGIRRFRVLTEHAWIEPGEAVSDELVLNLGDTQYELLMLELKLLVAASGEGHGKFSGNDAEVFARRVLALDDRLLDRVK